MQTETWLERCAAELQHLYLTNPHCGEPDAASDEWGIETAGELIEARVFWRDNE
jgi:hypothetical protein